jgi:CDP-diacylglycerol pyrophosphatase
MSRKAETRQGIEQDFHLALQRAMHQGCPYPSQLLPDAVGRRLGACFGLWIVAAALQACATSPTGHSNALWLLVDVGCNKGVNVVPSLQCDPAHGDAILKDRCGTTHYLLIPTARRSGVESPELLRDDEPEYFSNAWAARDRVIKASGRPDVHADELGLAVNSRWGRSQDQLHIHIDFIKPEIRDAISQWWREGAARPSIQLLGHSYRIIHVEALQRPSPFQLAAGAADTLEQRELNTIAVVGDGASGFYVLFGRADLAHLDRGHAEELLVDRHCGA